MFLRISIFVFVLLFFRCAKDKAPLPQAPVDIQDTTQPRINFVFVNRIGYKNDSTIHGTNDTFFVGILMDTKYWVKKENMLYLTSRAYNRNELNDPKSLLSDSVVFNEARRTIEIGNKFGLKIGLKWVNSIFPYTTKYLEFTTKNFSGNGDTIKEKKETTIKFVWPNDTNSGNFIKTYQFP